jgi:hypothetical protein
MRILEFFLLSLPVILFFAGSFFFVFKPAVKILINGNWYRTPVYFDESHEPYIIHQDKAVFIYTEDCVFRRVNWKHSKIRSYNTTAPERLIGCTRTD